MRLAALAESHEAFGYDRLPKVMYGQMVKSETLRSRDGARPVSAATGDTAAFGHATAIRDAASRVSTPDSQKKGHRLSVPSFTYQQLNLYLFSVNPPAPNSLRCAIGRTARAATAGAPAAA